MDIRRYLVLGTVHITVETAHRLDAWAALAPEDRPLSVASTSYGWFVTVPEPRSGGWPMLPSDLLAAVSLAREMGCDQLLLDSDSPADAALPTYPW